MAVTTLTRQDLVKFLPNQRAVNAFEGLFTQGNEAGIALAKANAAQATANTAQATAEAAQISADVAQITADSALGMSSYLILAPPLV
jgi:hypothetical protein